MEDLIANQKAELKELQAKIQHMKHSVPKGDKKKKKQIMAEITLLQSKMEEKHRSQIEEYGKIKTSENVQQDETEKPGEMSSNFASITINDMESDASPKKLSKAQKRREKKEDEERKRDKRLAEAEISNLSSARSIETNQLNAIMSEAGFMIKEIAPDGNCLYNAIADQLLAGEYDWKALRLLAAEKLRKNREQFIPFMTNLESGEPYTEEEFEKYCHEIETTNIWGGQLEIQALSSALGQPIEIFQADSPILKIGEDLDGKTIRISYHKHAYGLGEHYNSVVPKK